MFPWEINPYNNQGQQDAQGIKNKDPARGQGLFIEIPQRGGHHSKDQYKNVVIVKYGLYPGGFGKAEIRKKGKNTKQAGP